jgi:hypothetical protein
VNSEACRGVAGREQTSAVAALCTLGNAMALGLRL